MAGNLAGGRRDAILKACLQATLLRVREKAHSLAIALARLERPTILDTDMDTVRVLKAAGVALRDRRVNCGRRVGRLRPQYSGRWRVSDPAFVTAIVLGTTHVYTCCVTYMVIFRLTMGFAGARRVTSLQG